MLDLTELVPADVSFIDEQLELQKNKEIDFLSPKCHEELILSYKTSIKAKEALKETSDRQTILYLNKLVTLGQKHAEELVNSCFGLFWGKFNDEAKRRLGENWHRNGVDEEIKSEIKANILSQALVYDSSLGVAFTAFLSARKGRDALVSTTLRSYRARGRKMPQGWDRVVVMVSAIKNDFAEKGKVASKDDIVQSLEIKFDEWAQERLTSEELTYSKNEIVKIKETKLSKAGMTGAIKKIDEILELSLTETSLNLTKSEAGIELENFIITPETFNQTESDLALERLYKVALGDKAENLNGFMVAYHDLLGEVEGEAVLGENVTGKENWTLAKLSEETGLQRVEVRNVLKNQAQARLSAPHAQFAFLSNNITIEKEENSTFAKIRMIPKEMFADN